MSNVVLFILTLFLTDDNGLVTSIPSSNKITALSAKRIIIITTTTIVMIIPFNSQLLIHNNNNNNNNNDNNNNNSNVEVLIVKSIIR